ncbi:type IV pilus modification PilV family protein, partial [Hyalangium gracile]
MNRSRSSPRGTSLIEAMAALVVFSVGILGVMQ